MFVFQAHSIVDVLQNCKLNKISDNVLNQVRILRIQQLSNETRSKKPNPRKYDDSAEPSIRCISVLPV